MYVKCRTANRNQAITLSDPLAPPRPSPPPRARSNRAPRPNPHPLCLPIGNEGSFKTLYLLSRLSFDGCIRIEGILLHPPAEDSAAAPETTNHFNFVATS